MRASTVYVLFQMSLGLWMGSMATVYSPYLVSVGLSLPEIAAVNIAFFLTVVLMELPTGMLADGRSRAWSIRMGAAVHLIGAVAYAFISGFWGAVLCEIVVGIGLAFMSGAEQAWITDALARRGESDSLRKVLGTAAMYTSLSVLVGGIIGGQIGAYDLRFGMLVAGIVTFLPLLVSVFMMNGDGEPVERTTELDALRKSVNVLRCGKGLLWALAAACSFGLVLSFNHYWAVFFRGLVGPGNMSYTWLVIYGGAALGGFLIRRIDLREGQGSVAVILAIALTGLGMGCVGLVPGTLLPFMFAFTHEIGRGAFHPLLNTYVQRRVDSSYRATFGSLQSFVSRMGFALILLCVWLFSLGHETEPGLIAVTWFVNGSLLVLCAVLLWIFRPARS